MTPYRTCANPEGVSGKRLPRIIYNLRRSTSSTNGVGHSPRSGCACRAEPPVPPQNRRFADSRDPRRANLSNLRRIGYRARSRDSRGSGLAEPSRIRRLADPRHSRGCGSPNLPRIGGAAGFGDSRESGVSGATDHYMCRSRGATASMAALLLRRARVGHICTSHRARRFALLRAPRLSLMFVEGDAL